MGGGGHSEDQANLSCHTLNGALNTVFRNKEVLSTCELLIFHLRKVKKDTYIVEVLIVISCLSLVIYLSTFLLTILVVYVLS